VARTSPGHVKPHLPDVTAGKNGLTGAPNISTTETWKMKINMGVGCQGLFGVVVCFPETSQQTGAKNHHFHPPFRVKPSKPHNKDTC